MTPSSGNASRTNGASLPALQQALLDELPNVKVIRQEALNVRPLLNAEQLASRFHSECFENKNFTNVFFLVRPGGTGKTFTYNYIIMEVIARHLCVATCAWTGIAATLLQNDGSACNVKPNSYHTAFLRRQHIIIFDEASMIPKSLEAINNMFRDKCNSNIPSAGKVIVLGGYFRQVLPVAKRAGRAQIVEVCLKSSTLWPLSRISHFHTNMRVEEGEQILAEVSCHKKQTTKRKLIYIRRSPSRLEELNRLYLAAPQGHTAVFDGLCRQLAVF
ncbi:uncharacterized protein LOC130646016 [Hydractinia symbiolongicarpus]|uniref:uncharacterized protein LOC130646016 n=1 Tax=Hydractinia symbiolongicarpus TaxID=13093 RepID=UPI00254D79E6|nr:uncharacterized protein LOC130646016 [Hydractinia symbiolongicarpus]